jgi:hypothetical protein
MQLRIFSGLLTIDIFDVMQCDTCNGNTFTRINLYPSVNEYQAHWSIQSHMEHLCKAYGFWSMLLTLLTNKIFSSTFISTT